MIRWQGTIWWPPPGFLTTHTPIIAFSHQCIRPGYWQDRDSDLEGWQEACAAHSALVDGQSSPDASCTHGRRAEWRTTFARRFDRVFGFPASESIMRAVTEGCARIASVRSGELASTFSMVIDADAKDSVESTYQRYMGRRVRASINTVLAMRRIPSVPAALQVSFQGCNSTFAGESSPVTHQ